MRFYYICANQIERVKVIKTIETTTSNPSEEQIDASSEGKPLIEETPPTDVENYHYVYEDGETEITKKWVLNPVPEPLPIPEQSPSIDDLMLALTDLDAKREQDKADNELALAELATMIGGV